MHGPHLKATRRETTGYKESDTHAMVENRKVSVLIKGVDCAACAQILKAALAKAEGVFSFDVNLTSGRVAVIYDPEQVTPHILEDCIRRAGYGVSHDHMVLRFQDRGGETTSAVLQRTLDRFPAD